MAEDFPNLEGEINTQIHKAQKTQNRLNPNRATLRHVIIKLLRVRDKERILKAARENREVIYKKSPTRPSKIPLEKGKATCCSILGLNWWFRQ